MLLSQCTLLQTCYYFCSLEKRLWSPYLRGPRFSVSHHCTCKRRYTLQAHTSIYTHMCTNASQLTHRRINRKKPKQTLDYTSQYSSRESHQSIWHEAWLSWKWRMLSHTLSWAWHHLHWCEPRLDHYLQTWLKQKLTARCRLTEIWQSVENYPRAHSDVVAACILHYRYEFLQCAHLYQPTPQYKQLIPIIIPNSPNSTCFQCDWIIIIHRGISTNL